MTRSQLSDGDTVASGPAESPVERPCRSGCFHVATAVQRVCHLSGLAGMNKDSNIYKHVY